MTKEIAEKSPLWTFNEPIISCIFGTLRELKPIPLWQFLIVKLSVICKTSAINIIYYIDLDHLFHYININTGYWLFPVELKQ